MRFYHLSIDAAASMPVTPPFDGVHLHVIESRDDVLALVQQGCENLLEVVPGMQRCLDGGAVAGCAFIGPEFASIDWMALSDGAKRVIDSSPYPPHLAEGEACTAGAFTLRRFRHRGIAAYRLSEQIQYLHRKGVHVCYNTIAVDNVPSQRCVERYGATFDEVFRQRRILGRRRYRTVTVPSPG
jgi:GNAT superfamily N-acetyltransferase